MNRKNVAGFGRCVRLLAAAAVLYGAVGAGSASAHEWRNYQSGCGRINSADSVAHGYHYNSGLSQLMRDATSWSRTNNYDGTDINTFTVASVQYDTDVVVYDQNYTDWCGYNWHSPSNPFGTVGIANCIYLTQNPAGACERAEIRYDESMVLAPGVSVWYLRSLACHENGHTIGLDHVSGNSCMVNPPDMTRFGLTASDVWWINHMY